MIYSLFKFIVMQNLYEMFKLKKYKCDQYYYIII